MPKKLYLDIQTVSDADLKLYGARYYATHETTRAAIISWALDDSSVFQWTFDSLDEMPEILSRFAPDARIPVVMWYADFTAAIVEDCLGIRPLTNSVCVQSSLRGTGMPEKLQEWFRVGRTTGTKWYPGAETDLPREGQVSMYSQIDVLWYQVVFCLVGRYAPHDKQVQWAGFRRTARNRLQAIRTIHLYREERRAQRYEPDLI